MHVPLDRYRRDLHEAVPRVDIPLARPSSGCRPDALVELGYDEAEARREASRRSTAA
jgi:hypothetical protein